MRSWHSFAPDFGIPAEPALKHHGDVHFTAADAPHSGGVVVRVDSKHSEIPFPQGVVHGVYLQRIESASCLTDCG